MRDNELRTLPGATSSEPGDPQETWAAPGAPAERPDRECQRGDVLGRYVVIDRVGAGAMGAVYAAYDAELDRRVALKLVRASRGSNPVDRTRLLREAQAIAKLDHPHVIHVYDVGTVDDELFVAMEYVDGTTLAGWSSAGPRGWAEILVVLRQAGEGLAAAHAAGVVHRDFKPDNVLVSKSGRAKVVDFGIARLAASNSENVGSSLATPAADSQARANLTRTGAMLGTPAYMAPEQHSGAPGDEASDQFAFCVTAFEALFGERPFPGRTIAAIAAAKLEGRVQTPSRGAVPGWLQREILRGLAPLPADRHPSMRALLDALARDPRPRRRRGIAIAAVLLGGVGIGSVLMPDSGGSAADPCPMPSARMHAMWSDDLRERVRDGMSPVAGAQVTAAIDEQVAAWGQAHRLTCAAMWVDREISAEAFDGRMACLDSRQRMLAQATARLAAADGEAQALAVVRALPPMSDCEAPDWRTLPTDPAQRVATLDLLRRIDEVRSTLASHSRPVSADELTQLLDDARELGHGPALARALELVGEQESDAGHLDRAAELLQDAVWEALAAHVDAVAFDATLHLMWLEGYARGDAAAGQRREREADRLLDRVGREPALEARLSGRRGGLAFARKEFPEAMRWFQRAVELAPTDTLGQRLWRADQEFNLASARLAAGDVADALATYEALRTQWVAVVGDEHPELGAIDINMATALSRLGRGDEALAAAERAVAELELPGANQLSRGNAWDTLAGQRYEQHDDEGALQALQRALEVRTANLPADHPSIIGVRMHAAEVLIRTGRSAEAEEHIRAVEAAVPVGERDPELLAQLDLLRGLRAFAQEDLEGAYDLLSSAVHAAGEIDVATDTRARIVLGNVCRELGRLSEARELLEELLEREGLGEVDRATVERELAETLRIQHPEDPRAAALLRAAAERLREVGVDP